jgi:hypothetical protein
MTASVTTWASIDRRSCARAIRGLTFLTIPLFGPGPEALAQDSGVSLTLHNLSARGPGEVKAIDEKEVCKFCHTPHGGNERTPLWGHALSSVAAYETPVLHGQRGGSLVTPQPDGASRLCLSCHDGTVALGDLGPGRAGIQMAGAQKLGGDRRSLIGTDLSGSHPVSIAVADIVRPEGATGTDITIRPAAALLADPNVRLDRSGKIQCTTCHDPHSDLNYQAGKVPHFWVKPTVTEVCLSCHVLR